MYNAFFNFGKIYANTNFTIKNSNNHLGVLSNHDKKLYFKNNEDNFRETIEKLDDYQYIKVQDFVEGDYIRYIIGTQSHL